MKKSWIFSVLIGIFICLYIYKTPVYALEDMGSLEDYVELNQIQETLEEIMGKNSPDFKELVEQFITGEEPFSFSFVLTAIKELFFGQILDVKDTMIHVLILIIVAAILNNFANVFEKSQISDMSFYVVYLLLFSIMLNSFSIVNNMVLEVIQQLLAFMRVLMPAFFLTITFSTGITTSMVFYQLTLFLIYGVEGLFYYLIIPGIHLYVVLIFVDNLIKEDFLQKLADLIKDGIEWLLKVLFALVIGVNVVQGLVTPVVDSFKTQSLAKAASIVPGIGAAANAVTEVTIGAGIVIKNGVGVVGLVILAFICMVPLLKIGIISWMYKIMSAVTQPISDKRVSQCIAGVGDGTRLLARVLITVAVMFIVTIAIITAATTIRL